jgi:thiol-disulfide isomerase/thioredoxin
MLNFWATWCPPCRAEMPYLQQIHNEWTDRGLVLLAIDLGESSATVKSYLQSNNLSLPVLLDTRQEVGQKYNIRNIPTTFFIDKDGIIREIFFGAFPDKEIIERKLSKIIT